MKKAIPITVLILLAAGVVYYLKRCRSEPVPDRRPVDSIAAVDRAKDSLAAMKIADKDKLIDSFKVAFVDLKRHDDSLGKELAATSARLNAGAIAYRQLIERGNQAAARGDSGAIYRNADTMRRDGLAGLPLISQFSTLTDSFVRAHNEEMAIKDSIISWKDAVIAIKDDQIKGKDTTISIMKSNYNKVYADDVKKTKFINILKPAAIGGALVIAIELARAIIPKK